MCCLSSTHATVASTGLGLKERYRHVTAIMLNDVSYTLGSTLELFMTSLGIRGSVHPRRKFISSWRAPTHFYIV